MTYAHDAHCNLIHDGPAACPPRCEHDWTELTTHGDPELVYRCFTCGTIRTEPRRPWRRE